MPCIQLKRTNCAPHGCTNRGTVFISSSHHYRFIAATSPPQAIKEYALRVNKSSGRDLRLKTLPEDVEERLKDFAEDMLGLGHNELRTGTTLIWRSLSTNQHTCELR
ncbi:unnamed protein product [Cylicocyclus nassatus]|uniref:Uncharacterized protein n=1 Tax=Cylicocyclus nassatus TaxID=53992 RepID=A0AA36GHX9_CYLNA|nr:unnamed protein product [Cylicocyclus nassatus]